MQCRFASTALSIFYPVFPSNKSRIYAIVLSHAHTYCVHTRTRSCARTISTYVEKQMEQHFKYPCPGRRIDWHCENSWAHHFPSFSSYNLLIVARMEYAPINIFTRISSGLMCVRNILICLLCHTLSHKHLATIQMYCSFSFFYMKNERDGKRWRARIRRTTQVSSGVVVRTMNHISALYSSAESVYFVPFYSSDE